MRVALPAFLALGLLSWCSSPCAALVSPEQLTVKISAGERSSGAWTLANVLKADASVHDHGVVLLRDAVSPALVAECASCVDVCFEQCADALAARGLKLVDGFAFHEIVHRAKARFDMQLGEGSAPSPLPAKLLARAPWTPLLRKVLGEDMATIFTGAVVALPGAAPQPCHMDGGHLFHSTGGWQAEHLPPHCLNVFMPLVDVTATNGPTEFWPGTHRAAAAKAAGPQWDAGPGVQLAGSLGDLIVFDYRVVHRGQANVGESPRPVLYQTSGRPWFRDGLNFPEERLFERGRAASAAGFGGNSRSGKLKAKPGKSKGKKR